MFGEIPVFGVAGILLAEVADGFEVGLELKPGNGSLT